MNENSWTISGNPLIRARRELYDSEDPNGPYDSTVMRGKEREVFFFPAIKGAVFLIDPDFHGYSMIWFPCLGHDTSVTFPFFIPKAPHSIDKSAILWAFNYAQRYPNARSESDQIVTASLQKLQAM